MNESKYKSIVFNRDAFFAYLRNIIEANEKRIELKILNPRSLKIIFGYKIYVFLIK